MSLDNSEQTENSISEAFSGLWRSLTHNQRRFVVAMRECATKSEAAKAIGLTPDTIYRWPDAVDLAIELMDTQVKQAAVAILADAVAKAALIKVGGLDSEDEVVRQATSSEVLDRILGRATQAVKHEGTGPENEIVFKVSGIDLEHDV